MLRVLIAMVLAGATVPARAPAQVQDPGDGSHASWVVSETQVASVPARTAFPRRAGSLEMVGTRDMSSGEEGIDSTLQYRSEDEALIGTIYVYLPGLAHPGLAAFATQRGMMSNSPSQVRLVRSATADAGGVEDAAIRDDYLNYRGANASSAAFLKAGRWMIKIRVTGPEARLEDIDSAMDSLLDGIRFGRQNPAQPPSPILVGDCSSTGDQEDARLLDDPAGPEIAAIAFLGTFDGGGTIASNESGARQDLPSRVPRELCLSSALRIGNATIPVLRGADGGALSVDGRTRLIAIIGDNGASLEVVHAANLGRHVLLYHQIGSTSILGSYDDVPSDRQIGELLGNPESEAGRLRARVLFRPDQAPAMILPGESAPPPAPTT